MSRLTIVLFVFSLMFAARETAAQARWTETGGGVDYVSIQAPAALGANINWILPPADGAANQCLVTDGAGTLSWRNCTGTAFSLNADDGTPVNSVYVEAAGRVGIGITAPTAGVILDVAGTGAAASSIIVPRDTTANRPVTGVNGMLRYNSSTASFEVYENSEWTNTTNGFAGKIEIAAAANCRWPNAASGVYQNIAADTDCGAITASGGATAPGTKIPAIILNNLPPGDYEVVAHAAFKQQNATAGQQNCRWRFSDGTTTSGLAASGREDEGQGVMKGVFSYASTGNRTIQIQVLNVGGAANSCYIDNNETGLMKFEMLVKRI